MFCFFSDSDPDSEWYSVFCDDLLSSECCSEICDMLLIQGSGMWAGVITARHRRARLEFAKRHLEWTVEDWKMVWWSDETKINCLGSDGGTYVWIEAGEGLSDRRVEGTVKFGGGNLMMWGCMSWEGIGYACRIEGKMDADLYVSILEDEFQQSLEFMGWR